MDGTPRRQTEVFAADCAEGGVHAEEVRGEATGRVAGFLAAVFLRLSDLPHTYLHAAESAFGRGVDVEGNPTSRDIKSAHAPPLHVLAHRAGEGLLRYDDDLGGGLEAGGFPAVPGDGERG
jgi:hypothetical protein